MEKIKTEYVMKKLLNNPQNVVHEMVEGFQKIYNSAVKRLADPYSAVCVRADTTEVRDKKVSLISGGGSGHEPAHSGFIGKGMLTAAVAGNVFTSPTSDLVLAAIKATSGKPGTLLIVKNYTGDRLTFGIAREMAKSLGYKVEMVVVADDVAIEDVQGRRGIAGTVFVHKIAGAMAEKGATLEEIVAKVKAITPKIKSMGVALTPCTNPLVGHPSFEIESDQIEFGLGIHGEKGVLRTKIQTVDDIVRKIITENLVLKKNYDPKTPPKKTVLLVNNLGSTTTMEMMVVARSALQVLEEYKDIHISRVLCGHYMTSLDMQGISLSLLEDVDEETLSLLDAPTNAPAWPSDAVFKLTERSKDDQQIKVDLETKVDEKIIKFPEIVQNPKIKLATQFVTKKMLENIDEFTELDRITGDGDFGINIQNGCNSVDNFFAEQKTPSKNFFFDISLAIKKSMGGASGGIFSIFFLRLAQVLAERGNYYEGLLEGCKNIIQIGGADVGDRTLIDSLYPAVEAMAKLANEKKGSFLDILKAGAAEAQKGSDSTKKMKGKKGRSGYLGDRVLNYADPGSVAIAKIFAALVEFFEKN
ncbi:triokinase/fmn cyclase [Anaeramoeba ignava]|uniref:Triokinase/fmn cyclase n=1 Tax=Anaeramoeba ignava TaxID=1746090 RepID=A0A9Q0RBP8_ANAIG|nr:triokinase/fmn cyclase [Anaeramoeba ignava]